MVKKMFAVIKTGGKQYKVAKDDVIVIEKLNAEIGSTVTFDNVLALGEKSVRRPLPAPKFRRKSSNKHAMTRLSFSKRNAVRGIVVKTVIVSISRSSRSRISPNNHFKF